MVFESINPTNNKVIKTYSEDNIKKIETIIQNLEKKQSNWKKKNFTERAIVLNKIAKKLLENKNECAELMSLEMGKPLKQGISEIEKCGLVCDYYAKNSEEFLNNEIIKTEAKKSYVSYEPLGIILAIMPWNFPFWQIFRFFAPAMMAGNAVIIKPSPNISGCANKLQEIINESIKEDNIYQTIFANNDSVKKIIANKYISAVTLTGSAKAGKAVAKIAGDNLKKVVLELGGNDPYLILEDANISRAIEACITARLINSGQSCIAAKRIVVHKKVKEEFLKTILEKLSLKKIGNPLENVDIGPLARLDLRDTLHRQVKESIKMGAECLLGGKIPKDKGNFYPITLLDNINENMPVFKEETFGPIFTIISAENESKMIELANNSEYGLGAAIFTENLEKGSKIAKKLNVGSCFINDFVKSDPRLPFGGIKNSGYGKELSSYGIKEFCNLKTIYIK